MDHRNSNYRLNKYNNNSQYQVYRQDNQNRHDNQNRQDNQNNGGNRGGNNYNTQGQNSSNGRYNSSNYQGGSSYQSQSTSYSHGNYGSSTSGNNQGHYSNSDRRGGDSRRSGGSSGYQKDRYSSSNNYHGGQSSGYQGSSNIHHGGSGGNYGNNQSQGGGYSGGYSGGHNSSRGGNNYQNNDRDSRRLQNNNRSGNYNDRNYDRRRNERNDNRSNHYGSSGHHGGSGGHHQNTHNRYSGGYHHNQSSNQVQNFYNNQRHISQKDRNNTETFHIRVFHNWVKSVLISKYGEIQRTIVKAENTSGSLPDNCLYVLDLACGKGGDHKKWLMHSHAAFYIGVDISLDSLNQAYTRAVATLTEIKSNSRHHSNIKFGFFEKDCTCSSEEFWKNIVNPPTGTNNEGDQVNQTSENMAIEGEQRNQGSPNAKEGENGTSSSKKEGDEANAKIDKNSKYMFDIVSCQMSMHYMYKSEQNVRNFLDNCTSKMNDQGFLLLTFTDGDAVLDSIKRKGTPNEQGGSIYTSKHFSIKFNTPVDQIDLNAKPYGNEYDFYLQEAVGTNDNGIIKYVPEYLVNTTNFIQLAKEYSLEVKENNLLTDFFEANKTQFGGLLKQMKVNFTPEEDQKDPTAWEVSHCYRTLVFQKTLSQPNRVQFDRSTREKKLMKYPVPINYKKDK